MSALGGARHCFCVVKPSFAMTQVEAAERKAIDAEAAAAEERLRELQRKMAEQAAVRAAAAKAKKEARSADKGKGGKREKISFTISSALR